MKKKVVCPLETAWVEGECPAASDLTARLTVKQWDLWEGAWNPGQVPSPVVDNIHEGLPPLLSSTQEFTAPPPPATLLSIEILGSDRGRRLLLLLGGRVVASLGNSAEVCLHFPRISGIIREIK